MNMTQAQMRTRDEMELYHNPAFQRLSETNVRLELRIEALEEQVAEMKAARPEPLTWPPIDLGLIEGTKCS